MGHYLGADLCRAYYIYTSQVSRVRKEKALDSRRVVFLWHDSFSNGHTNYFGNHSGNECLIMENQPLQQKPPEGPVQRKITWKAGALYIAIFLLVHFLLQFAMGRQKSLSDFLVSTVIFTITYGIFIYAYNRDIEKNPKKYEPVNSKISTKEKVAGIIFAIAIIMIFVGFGLGLGDCDLVTSNVLCSKNLSRIFVLSFTALIIVAGILWLRSDGPKRIYRSQAALEKIPLWRRILFAAVIIGGGVTLVYFMNH